MAAIGAALKKIAVAILSNPKSWKTICGIILGIIIIVISPFAAVLGLMSGDIKIDNDRLSQLVAENLTEAETSRLQMMNDTMTEVERQLDEKGLYDYKIHAEVLYAVFLVDKSQDENFIPDFVKCFKKDSNTESIVNEVSKRFNVEINVDEVEKMVTSINGARMTADGFKDKSVKNNTDLVLWCVRACKNGWGYVYGGYGQLCSEEFLDAQAELFPGDDEAGGNMRTVGEKWNGKRVVDCIGLIKSYAWYDPESNEIAAGTNGFKDCGANSIWNNVTESGDISAMPDIPGLAVWMDGHIGVYIGNGEVIEAQGTNEGVVKTKLRSRTWKKWLMIPHIKYEAEEKTDEASKTESSNNGGTGSHR